MSKKALFLLKSIDYGYKHNLYSVIVSNTLLVLDLCAFLKKEGFILNYIVESSREVKIYLLSALFENVKNVKSGNLLFKTTFNFSKPYKVFYFGLSHKKPVSVKGLRSLFQISAVDVISTDRGLLSSKEAIKLNVGGKFLFRIRL